MCFLKEKFDSLVDSDLDFVKDLLRVCNASENLTLTIDRADDFFIPDDAIGSAREDFQYAFVDFVEKWSLTDVSKSN